MTKRQLEKLLAHAGFRKREGGRHDVWVKSGFPPIPVPRHKGDIPEGTAKNIIKSAGLKENIK
jgi:predicted RNA binding protein YcfA (HicA-like mRNA interferase family)